MKSLPLVAFIWCSLGIHVLDAQEKRPVRTSSPRLLLDAPGPGYREQRDRFAPASVGEMKWQWHVRAEPALGRVISDAKFAVSGDESSEARKERLEFERRFEELKAQLQKMSAP